MGAPIQGIEALGRWLVKNETEEPQEDSESPSSLSPPVMQNPTIVKSIPGALSHWTEAASHGAWGQAQLSSRTRHIGLQLCFSFVVGVWGGGWGREGRAILGFWFVPY